jgi:ADP-ribosylglycohydrolase
MTVSRGLRGNPNPDSQANGAMMRISPLGIFGANHDFEHVAEWARQDAEYRGFSPGPTASFPFDTFCTEI